MFGLAWHLPSNYTRLVTLLYLERPSTHRPHQGAPYTNDSGGVLRNHAGDAEDHAEFGDGYLFYVQFRYPHMKPTLPFDR